MKGNMCTL